MRPLQPSELPAHADLAQLQTSNTTPDLHAFITEALNEANTFMTEYLPKNFIVKAENKPAAPSKATVKLLEKTIPASEIPHKHVTEPETWFARTSTHENKRETGTATWDEFEGGLLDNHSQHEMEYTPDVYDAHKVLSWDGSISPIEGWEKVGLSVYEMAHKIPPPLNNRVFSVAIVTARSKATPTQFLVVQIPVDISRVSGALYSNGRNKTEGDDALKKKAVEMGQYVSIERCELIDDGAKVMWQMGTASDAKGVLPMWIQKMAVPGTVVKDVSLFIDWTQKRR